MSPTAVAAPFPGNEGDDIESQIAREVLTIGRGMLSQALRNLLISRLVEEMFWWERRLAYEAYRVRLRAKHTGN